jgi:hypothetical protein
LSAVVAALIRRREKGGKEEEPEEAVEAAEAAGTLSQHSCAFCGVALLQLGGIVATGMFENAAAVAAAADGKHIAHEVATTPTKRRAAKKKRTRCSGCKVAYYCGTLCQNKHWHEHKRHCGQKKLLVRSTTGTLSTISTTSGAFCDGSGARVGAGEKGAGGSDYTVNVPATTTALVDQAHEFLCAICMAAPVAATLVHSDGNGHRCVCCDCGDKLKSNSTPCPICRKDILVVLKAVFEI